MPHLKESFPSSWNQTLATSEARDREGLYAKALAGLVQQFMGISDPYEARKDAVVAIDTAAMAPAEAVREIFLHLEPRGCIGVNGDEPSPALRKRDANGVSAKAWVALEAQTTMGVVEGRALPGAVGLRHENAVGLKGRRCDG
jgi:hypothetical protein